jgi:outer membrane protein
MKHFFFFIFLSFPFISSGFTLKEAFESSKKNMESIRRAKVLTSAAEEQRVQARAGLLPTLSAVGNVTRIDSPSDASVSRVFTLTKQHSAALRLNQPLIRGGALASLSLAKDQVLLARFQEESTELNLYSLIIDAYYSYFQALGDRNNLKQLEKFSRDRVGELHSRTKIGRSRRGELVQAEAQHLTASSQLEQGEISLAAARETLTFYTGLENFEDMKSKLDFIKPKEIGPLLEKLKSRPDLKSSQQEIELAEKRVQIAKGGHYPQLDFVGNYYFDRTGPLASSDWDAALVVNIPLFQGGAVSSQVREAVSQKSAAKYQFQQTLRNAETNLRIRFSNYRLILDQLKNLEKGVKKAEEAYSLNKQDYQNGLVSNLDVLQSLNIFIESKRSYDQLILEAHKIQKQIEASLGELP